MTKRYRVNNNFLRWIKRSIPFFLVLFFLAFNFAVFTFQPKSYFSQSMYGWNETHTEKQVHISSFELIYTLKHMSTLTQQLQAQYAAQDNYPRKLEDLEMHPNTKNWIYKPSFKTYDLIYKGTK